MCIVSCISSKNPLDLMCERQYRTRSILFPAVSIGRIELECRRMSPSFNLRHSVVFERPVAQDRLLNVERRFSGTDAIWCCSRTFFLLPELYFLECTLAPIPFASLDSFYRAQTRAIVCVDTSFNLAISVNAPFCSFPSVLTLCRRR
jgi:hypothetical protein